MPANRKPSPKAITLRIARLRRFARPRRGPGDEPPADLEITDLKITLPAKPPTDTTEPDLPPPGATGKPSLLARLMPAWPDLEFRRHLTWKVLLPLFLFLGFIALIVKISG